MSRVKICVKPRVNWGKRLKVPVYAFLKESIVRKYGEEFYAALEAAAKYVESK